jgi:hypothetical protein
MAIRAVLARAIAVLIAHGVAAAVEVIPALGLVRRPLGLDCGIRMQQNDLSRHFCVI